MLLRCCTSGQVGFLPATHLIHILPGERPCLILQVNPTSHHLLPPGLLPALPCWWDGQCARGAGAFLLLPFLLLAGGDRASSGAANQYRAWLRLRPHWGAEGRPSVQVTSPSPHPPPSSSSSSSSSSNLFRYLSPLWAPSRPTCDKCRLPAWNTIIRMSETTPCAASWTSALPHPSSFVPSTSEFIFANVVPQNKCF